MRNGYYLFIYSEINSILNTLKLSSRHDHNLALFYKTNDTIKLICHLEFERFSGIKHHNVAFFNKEEARLYVNKLLKPYGLSIDDCIEVYGTPRMMDYDEGLSFTSIQDINDISCHAIAHLFSSLLSDTDLFFSNDIVALSLDGGSDNVLDKDINKKKLFCGAVSRKGQIEYFPISSPGGYWWYVSDYFNMTEGSLMALAYASKAKSLESFSCLPEYYQISDYYKFIDAIDKIISRIMNYKKNDIEVLYTTDENFTEKENKISMIMKIIQELSIQSVSEQLEIILDKYALSAEHTILSLSGGYSLNCPTNTKIMHKFGFKKQLCVPCLNDSGLSIGMGLYYFYKQKEKFKFRLENAFYGFSDNPYIKTTITNYCNFIKSVKNSIDFVAEDISFEPVIWIDGSAEIGPRALGHRSILGNPQKESHKNLLNQYKQREWWRPVAPIIMEEHVSEWFEKSFSSPYMLNNFRVHEKLASKIPAVIHFDGSARVQTINKSNDSKIWEVIKKFYDLTGIPMICNTSLNDKGEPIINNLEQAINFALRKKIRIIYAYGIRIELKNFEQYNIENFLPRDNIVFEKHSEDKNYILKTINLNNLSEIDLIFYIVNPKLQRYDITQEKDAKTVKKIINRIKKDKMNIKLFEIWTNMFQ